MLKEVLCGASGMVDDFRSGAHSLFEGVSGEFLKICHSNPVQVVFNTFRTWS